MSDVAFLDAEDDLAALLGGLVITAPPESTDPVTAVPVLTYVPEAVQPPVVVLQPAEEWLATGDEAATFAQEEYVVTEEVWALVELVDNQAAARELRELLESIVAAVGPSAWWIVSIGQPGPLHTSEWMNHGVRVTVARYVSVTA